MSCRVMNPEPLAALANAIESVLNCGYNFWGFEAPDNLFLELNDCRTIRLYDAIAIYRRLYALNVRAYNGRYRNHEIPMDEKAPAIDVDQHTVHHGPKYREHGFAVQPWHYHLAKLLDYWIYQTAEEAVYKDPLRLAVQEFRDCLYAFIIRNSPQYTDMRLEELRLPNVDETRKGVVYHINTIPGRAAAQKGHASYPEDFPRLRPGETFAAWRVGEDWEIETMLGEKAILARLDIIEKQEAGDCLREFRRMISFADEVSFDAEIARNQLRSLWTAHCLHHGLNVDTSRYDHDLLELWTKIKSSESIAACWSNYSSFDKFMCANLV